MAFRHVSEALDGVLAGLGIERTVRQGSDERARPGPPLEIWRLPCREDRQPPRAGGNRAITLRPEEVTSAELE